MKIIYYVEREGFFYKHFIDFATLEDENVFKDCIYVTKYHCDYDYKYNKFKFELSNKECLKNAIKNGIFKKGIYKRKSQWDSDLYLDESEQRLKPPFERWFDTYEEANNFINKYNEDKKKELDIIQNMSEYDYSMMELNKQLKIYKNLGLENKILEYINDNHLQSFELKIYNGILKLKDTTCQVTANYDKNTDMSTNICGIIDYKNKRYFVPVDYVKQINELSSGISKFKKDKNKNKDILDKINNIKKKCINDKLYLY